MKNLRLSEVSGPGRSARADLEPPKQIQKVGNGHVASSGPWEIDINLLFGCFVAERRITGLGWFFKPFSFIFGFQRILQLSLSNLSFRGFSQDSVVGKKIDLASRSILT